ncbi:MAG: hypothetical protein N2235_00185 [Fischerella sp.]|nr:hypothetical protein [Fischerella sp.]
MSNTSKGDFASHELAIATSLPSCANSTICPSPTRSLSTQTSLPHQAHM